MAENKRTSELTAASTLDGTELMHVVQGGNSRQTTAADVANLSGFNRDDVTALLADTTLTYTAGQPGTVAAGDYVQTRAEGFAYEVAAAGAVDQDETTAGGVKLYELSVPVSKTYTVGSGGDYATINAAIEDLSKRRPLQKTPQIQTTLQLVSGFIMSEQVIADGVDLGWIKIGSVDATVTIVGSSMETRSVTVDGTAKHPAFAAINGGTLPEINTLFTVDGTGSLTTRVGLAVTSGGRATVSAAKGITNAPRDAVNLDRGYLKARGANFSSAGNYGAYLFNAAYLDGEQANFSGAGADGVIVTRNSGANLTRANASGATVNGVLATQGAVVNCGEINASNCGGAGLRARGSATVNANSGDVSGCFDGVYADRNSNFSVTDDTSSFDASGCTRYGLFVRNGARVSGENINCNGSRVYVEKGGKLVAPGLSAVGAVNSVPAVFVDSGGDARIPNCNVNNSGTGAAAALQCTAGSVHAEGGTFESANQIAIYSRDGGVVRAEGATITATNNAAVFAYGGDVIAPASTINVVDNILIDTLNGGRVDLPSLTITRTGTAPGTSVRLRDGAYVNISGTSGENLNVTANTISASGICIQ